MIVVDLPGHGRSGTAGRRPGPEQRGATADDLATILRRLDAAPAHVIGYSLGARIALRLAIAHPDVVRPARPREPVGRDRRSGGARRPADRRRGPRPQASSATGSRRSSPSGRRSPSSRRQRALPPARAARIRARSGCANRPAGLAASLRGAGQGAMEPLHDRLAAVAGADPRHRRRPRRRRPPDAPRPSPPGSRAPGSPSSTVPGTRPTTRRPAAFRRLALDFLQEDAA